MNADYDGERLKLISRARLPRDIALMKKMPQLPEGFYEPLNKAMAQVKDASDKVEQHLVESVEKARQGE